MSMITLVSGGLDSTLVAMLTRDAGIQQYPLFIDYGQRAKDLELSTCLAEFERLELPKPEVMNLAGFGQLIPSGLTSSELDVNSDAFLPGRNSLFLTAASSYACAMRADSVAIGLLNEDTHLFPDQTSEFLDMVQQLIDVSLMSRIKLVAPLMHMTKADVVGVAASLGIQSTYSCHSGFEKPCGLCVSCLEYVGIE